MTTPIIHADGIPVYCSFDELADLAALVPNPRNPNQHKDKQIDLLAKIIKNQGWRAPITVSNRSGFIVRGHGRLLAAQRLGVSQVPVDRQDYANEAEEWADLIADNRIAEQLEISVRQLYRWYRDHPELCQAKNEGKNFADIDVEDSLLKRAKGYDVEETEVVASKDGRPVRVKKIKRHIPADVRACRIWLSNRQPDRWGNRQEHSHQVEVNQTTKVTNSNIVVYLPDNKREKGGNGHDRA